MEEADGRGYWASSGGEQCGGFAADVQDHGRPLDPGSSAPSPWPQCSCSPRAPRLSHPDALLPLVTGPVLSPGCCCPLPPEAIPLQARQPPSSARHPSAPQRPHPSAPSAPAAPPLSAHSLKYSAGDVHWGHEVSLASPRPLPGVPDPHEAGLCVAPEAVAQLCRASSSLRGGLVKCKYNWTHDGYFLACSCQLTKLSDLLGFC